MISTFCVLSSHPEPPPNPPEVTLCITLESFVVQWFNFTTKAHDTSPDSIVNRLTRRNNVDGDLAGIISDGFHDLRSCISI
jgi:hypothetical protein